jgi:DNA invertase Pin-like site-specific DNA recombinase
LAIGTTRYAAIYARVSTSQQNSLNQLRELRESAERFGWHVVTELVDNGISGAKGREQRPAFDRLLSMVHRREIDVVMAWSIDRLGRSIRDLTNFMGEIQARSVDLYIHKQAIDTSTPSGRMVFGIFSALGEYERELLRERINAGLARAKAEGKKLGRPTNVNSSVVTSVKLLRQNGHSIHKIAKSLRIGVGTTQKILAAA